MIELPPPLDRYFDAANGGHADLLASVFAAHARVCDERENHVGRAAIRDWATEVRRKYSFRSEPFAVEGDSAQAIVRAKVSGDFPGSPIDLAYRFEIADGAIAKLSIG